MLGFSLRDGVFLGHPSKKSKNDLIAHCKDVGGFLEVLKQEGVRSIELRVLPRFAEGHAYKEVVQQIWQAGMQLTVHGEAGGPFEGAGFIDTYPSMGYILQHFSSYQPDLTVALHALAGPGEYGAASEEELHAETVRRLRRWAEMIEAEQLPLAIMLENNRKKGKRIDPGNSMQAVLRMVEETESPHVGIAWDMGHSYANLLTAAGLRQPPDEAIEAMPSAAFLSRVRHTHIHGLGASGTHNPLTERNSLPLERYVSELCHSGYKGVYNLELDMDKFAEGLRLDEQVLTSVRRLRLAIEKSSGLTRGGSKGEDSPSFSR